MARYGKVWQGIARYGKEWPDMAGIARYGRHNKTARYCRVHLSTEFISYIHNINCIKRTIKHEG